MLKKSNNISEGSNLNENINSADCSIIVEDLWKTFKVPLERRYKLHEHVASFLLRKNRGYNYLPIFQGISFKVQRGGTLGIIGDNGSGKSTLLKILSKIIYPEKGKVDIRGKVASFIELGVGFDYNLTAEENIFLYGAILGLPRKTIIQNLMDIYDFSELKTFRYMKLRNFSPGMLLRLAFSTAMQMDPDILLLDEIIVVGDQDFQKKCMDKINDFIRNEKTIVFVSHSLPWVQRICKNAIWLNKGVIASYGERAKVIHDYEDYVNKKTQKRLEAGKN